MSKKIKIISQIIIVLVIAAGISYYFYNQYYLEPKQQINEKTKIINEIAALKFIKQDLDQAQKDKYQKKFDDQAKIFLVNTNNAAGFWPLITISQIKEITGDFKGAEQALLLAADLQPQAYTAHANLADLYFHTFKDFAKAEEHYLKAIEPDDPKTLNFYLELHEIYDHFYKQDTALAEDILKQGIERYSGASETVELMLTLAQYYQKNGKIEQAREYYQKALKIYPDSQVAKKALEELENQ